jgi:hypothetical protein
MGLAEPSPQRERVAAKQPDEEVWRAEGDHASHPLTRPSGDTLSLWERVGL